ncbi:hypothetical protein UA08_01105 [Talaromyces atroroseus]|uniref:Uncharacterized protein n=1 Tax=Talaromyces atroroseus TaxID=1441469 RepID=A0A225AZY3_TALAT|nr:hypothetical protein UA08_01105 [Talaromyces atroroseus]OKL64014.1 hypothetical protein UA08_01105 [Talaromyces atroroseus]
MKSAQIIAAAGLLLASTVHATASSVYSGSGFGTYYYDVVETDECGDNFEVANTGQVECSLTQVWTLNDVNSDYLVAMNHSLLVGDMSEYCGKKVIVSVNGVASDLPLFIGDGCERCSEGSATSATWDPYGAPGLDFSYTVANELNSLACDDGHIEITWEVVDELIYQFDTTGSGEPQGFVSTSSSSAVAQATAAPKRFHA